MNFYNLFLDIIFTCTHIYIHVIIIILLYKSKDFLYLLQYLCRVAEIGVTSMYFITNSM